MYTHFASGFCRDGKLDREFESLMRRLACKNGWFVPVATLLDNLRQTRERSDISRKELVNMERCWARSKLREAWRHNRGKR